MYGYPYVLCVHIHVFTMCTSVFLHYDVSMSTLYRDTVNKHAYPHNAHICIYAHIHNVPRYMIYLFTPATADGESTKLSTGLSLIV